MSEVAIRRAIEQRLNSMTPALVTAWENATFKPQPSVAYQRVQMVPAIPDNVANMTMFHRLQGLYQVQLMYPLDKGPGDAEGRYEAIKARFPKGLSITQDGVTVTISGTVYRSGASTKDGDRWSLTVRIPYYANISP
jgi:hypothetical protein